VTSFADFARGYQAAFRAAIDGWDLAALEKMAAELGACRARGGTVYVIGNGGSAAIANHLECDVTKGTLADGAPVLASRSLSSNPSMLTALGNDVGFEFIFSEQVGYFVKPSDVLVLVSSGGKSANMVRAFEAAKKVGVRTVALVGFDGGHLRGLADLVVHVPVHNYGIVEDLHQASIHLVSQFLRASAAEAGRP
jgi:phosphoheptose isomerase